MPNQGERAASGERPTRDRSARLTTATRRISNAAAWSGGTPIHASAGKNCGSAGHSEYMKCTACIQVRGARRRRFRTSDLENVLGGNNSKQSITRGQAPSVGPARRPAPDSRREASNKHKAALLIGCVQDGCFISPLKKSFCYERLHSTQASFSTENDLNVALGHDFGHFRSRALPASNSLALATNAFINGLICSGIICGSSGLSRLKRK